MQVKYVLLCVREFYKQYNCLYYNDMSYVRLTFWQNLCKVHNYFMPKSIRYYRFIDMLKLDYGIPSLRRSMTIYTNSRLKRLPKYHTLLQLVWSVQLHIASVNMFTSTHFDHRYPECNSSGSRDINCDHFHSHKSLPSTI